MLYIAHETPPLPTVLAVGIQHLLVALMLLIYVVIAGKGIGLADAPLRDFVSLSVVVMGLGTLLNSLTTRVSAGHLLVHIPDPVMMTAFIAVTTAFGPSAAAGGLLVGGIVVFGLGRFLPRLQVLFPPEVTGILLVLLGMSLIPGGIERAIGLDRGGINATSILIAGTALGSLVAVSVWAGERVRVLALIIGAAAGMLVAVLTGEFGAAELARVVTQPPISLPIGNYIPPTPTWVPAAIIPLVLILVINAVDALGGGVVIDKMNNDKWRRTDLPMIGRLLNGMGLCTIVSGLVGTLSTGISSANLGLAHMTGVAARRAGTMTGLLLIA
ncbi:solute carrier family 23 protein, partial [uncultured Lamprocystis sp.]